MKKITESQLKDKVNSLREYLKVYEAEMKAQGDDAGNTTITRPDGSTMVIGPDGKQIMPGSNPNLPQNKGILNTASNWLQNKGEFQKPTGFIPPAPDLANMDIGFGPGKFQPDTNQAASVTPTDTDLANMDIGFGPGKFTPDSAPSAPAPGEQATKIAKFKALIAKAKAKTTAPAAAQSPYALQANGAKLKANEGTDYFLKKLRLIESQQLDEDLTAAEQKEMDDLAIELGQQGAEADPELSALINDYNSLKAPSAATPAAPETNQAAAVKPTGPITWKQIYDLNKDVIGANPNLIKPGQQLKMPDGSTYTVKAGDNLSKIAKNAGSGQGASVTPTAPTAPTAPTKPTAPTAPAAPAGRKELPKELSTAPAASATGIVPGQNARDDLLARQGKGQKTIDLSNSSRYTDGTPRVKESVGYNELQRIVSLVNHR